MYNTTIAAGKTFDETLPGWGSGPFVAASTAQIANINGTAITLTATSLADVTKQVHSNGRVEVKFPATPKDTEYQIFAIYLQRSGYREVTLQTNVTVAVPQSPITNYKQNGSFVVDHFSARGAQTIIDYWEENLLSGNSRELLKTIGNVLWEDSQEYGAGVNVLWTPSLPKAFQRSRGYSINKYLPLIWAAGSGSLGTVPVTYTLDSSDGGQSYIQDYEQTVRGFSPARDHC